MDTIKNLNMLAKKAAAAGDFAAVAQIATAIATIESSRPQQVTQQPLASAPKEEIIKKASVVITAKYGKTAMASPNAQSLFKYVIDNGKDITNEITNEIKEEVTAGRYYSYDLGADGLLYNANGQNVSEKDINKYHPLKYWKNTVKQKFVTIIKKGRYYVAFENKIDATGKDMVRVHVASPSKRMITTATEEELEESFDDEM